MLDGASVALAFTGKSGKARTVDLDDAALARTLRFAQELPGQRLFRYRDGAGRVRDVHSQDVNVYLQEATGHETSAKDFRTWGAMLTPRPGLPVHRGARWRAPSRASGPTA